MVPDEITVELGAHTYTVRARPLPRVFRALSGLQGRLQGVDTDRGMDAAIVSLGDQAHDLLRVFIPDLMGKPEFSGFASERAMEEGEDDDAAMDRAPTFPQIIEAFEAAFRVNGGERVGELAGKVLGPEVAKVVQRLALAAISETLQTSPREPGDSAQPTSTTNETGALVAAA